MKLALVAVGCGLTPRRAWAGELYDREVVADWNCLWPIDMAPVSLRVARLWPGNAGISVRSACVRPPLSSPVPPRQVLPAVGMAQLRM